MYNKVTVFVRALFTEKKCIIIRWFEEKWEPISRTRCRRRIPSGHLCRPLGLKCLKEQRVHGVLSPRCLQRQKCQQSWEVVCFLFTWRMCWFWACLYLPMFWNQFVHTWSAHFILPVRLWPCNHEKIKQEQHSIWRRTAINCLRKQKLKRNLWQLCFIKETQHAPFSRPAKVWAKQFNSKSLHEKSFGRLITVQMTLYNRPVSIITLYNRPAQRL